MKGDPYPEGFPQGHCEITREERELLVGVGALPGTTSQLALGGIRCIVCRVGRGETVDSNKLEQCVDLPYEVSAYLLKKLVNGGLLLPCGTRPSTRPDGRGRPIALYGATSEFEIVAKKVTPPDDCIDL